MKLIHLFISIWVLLLLVIQGCESDDPRLVAKVGKHTLTADMLEGAASTEAYIDAWLRKSLLAEEAESRGLADTPEFARKMETVRTSVLADALLKTEASKLNSPDARKIDDYYSTHLREFLLTNPEVEFVYFSGLDLSELNGALSKLRRGMKEATVASRHPGLDFGRKSMPVAEAVSEPFSEFIGMKTGATKGPVEIEGRQYIFKITRRWEPGDTLTLDRVRDEVVYRILENERYLLRERLLKQLKSKYNPVVNIERLRALGIAFGDDG